LNTDANSACHWREFEKNLVSHSAAHYLMAIDTLRRDLGYARVTDVAVRLEVTRAAASAALSQLKKRELVAEDPNRFLLLTEEGSRVVQQVELNFRTLSRFFEEVLRVSPEVAHADACKMEHLMSLETGRRLLCLMALMLDDAEHRATMGAAMAEFENHLAQEADGDGGGSL
jgi:Mn-dependent DtxR family transcriptional regulator